MGAEWGGGGGVGGVPGAVNLDKPDSSNFDVIVSFIKIHSLLLPTKDNIKFEILLVKILSLKQNQNQIFPANIEKIYETTSCSYMPCQVIEIK